MTSHRRAPRPRRGAAPRRSTARRRARAGWLFVAPVVVILGLFLLLPILMALCVSLTRWNGQASPFRRRCRFVGLDNYTPACSPATT